MGRSRRRSATAAAGAVLVALAAAAAPALAQPDAAAPGTLPARAVDRDYLIGAWTDSDDCAVAVDFAGDGTFVTIEGGEGLWRLDGDDLTLAGAGGVRRLTIIPVDDDTMDVINEDGTRGRSTRCAADAGSDPRFAADRIA